TNDRVEWLTIPTRARTETVIRAIWSYAENARKYNHPVRVMVIESSEESSTRDRLKADAPPDAYIRYIGFPEADAFSKALIKAGIEPEIVHFALSSRDRTGPC